ncbi:MAG: hypothetical protein IGR93_21670 [Hydrococcus sp. C42_A2020_068]|nr:hypothetical protein [Hydrococcus sp. C42_A2020_068]
MKTATRPKEWQVGLILFIGILAVSTAAIFIRLSTESAGGRGVGFSLFLAASRLIKSKTIVYPLVTLGKLSS